jgi:hypothetical protein
MKVISFRVAQLLIKSISNGVQYVTYNSIFHIEVYLFIYIFSSLTNKIKTSTANLWRLLIANHLDQSLWLANQKIKQ